MKADRRYVILRTEDGKYVGRRGKETILVKERERALVWDWEHDKVEESIAEVKRLFGAVWTPEPAYPKNPAIASSRTRMKPEGSSPLIDPSGCNVIILVGEFAGVEGFCLGPTHDGLWAVTPKASEKILALQFDDEFGVLLNKGQQLERN